MGQQSVFKDHVFTNDLERCRSYTFELATFSDYRENDMTCMRLTHGNYGVYRWQLGAYDTWLLRGLRGAF